MIGKKIAKLILFIAFTFTPFANAMAQKENYPFDPAKIPMDENWEKVLLNEGGFLPRWCGPRQLFFHSAPMGYWLADVFTGEVKSLPRNPDYQDHFLDCTPSGSHIIFKRGYYKGREGTNSFVVYDAKKGKDVAFFPYSKEKLPIISSFYHSFLSPNGKYMAWYEEGVVRFGKGNKFELVHVFEDNKERLLDFAWTPDNKRAFLLKSTEGKRPQELIVYDREKKRRKTFFFDLGKHSAIRIKVSPDGKRLYFKAALFWHFYNYLYRFNLDDLDLSASTIKPELLANGFNSFSLGPDGAIVFNSVPSPDGKSEFPFTFAGIYLADMDGKVTGRLTTGHYDTQPIFSKDGNMIVFDRTDPKIPGNWKSYINVLFKKER